MVYTYAKVKPLTKIVYIFLTNLFKIYTIKTKSFNKFIVKIC